MSKTGEAVTAVPSNPKTDSKSDISGDTDALNAPPNRLDELNLNDLTVEIKDLKFSYEKSEGLLLNDISMTFPRSAIYGFLGPSGCGKTTIIKLIVGQLKPSSGRILVNNKQVFHPSNRIPGPGVGYMPQEYALYGEFTILETLNYFSRIYGLSNEYRKKRIEFLIKFLDLPDQNRLVRVLSGGQKRRTSLAVAIVHNPPLLILDEPTVGVDPMLRERIWTHLLELSTQEQTSILITTHYIEECRRAHIIALMRNGKILVENSPTNLINHFKQSNLEDIFLQVCRSEEQKSLAMPPNVGQVRASRRHKGRSLTSKITKVWSNEKSTSTLTSRFLALAHKNFIRLWRQKLLLFTILILPMISVTMFCLFIGKAPFDLDIAVYNAEAADGNTTGGNKTGGKHKHSLRLLEIIAMNDTLNLKKYDSNQTALDSVRDGVTFGALIIPHNFSELYSKRLDLKALLFGNPENTNGDIIQFFGDLTNVIVYQTMFEKLVLSEVMFRKEAALKAAEAANATKNQTELLSKSMDQIIQIVPIYGTLRPEAIDVITPGMILVIVYFLSMALICLNLVTERKEGLLDRTLVAGVSMPEILINEIVVQLVILLFQIFLLLIIIFVVFGVYNRGNLIFIISITVLQGACGMAFGLLLSSMAKTEDQALMMCVGSLIPFMVISGIIWPLEGMHHILRRISFLTPQTLAVISLKNIMLKGWSITRTMVWAGYLSSMIWIVVLIILALIFNNLRTD